MTSTVSVPGNLARPISFPNSSNCETLLSSRLRSTIQDVHLPFNLPKVHELDILRDVSSPDNVEDRNDLANEGNRQDSIIAQTNSIGFKRNMYSYPVSGSTPRSVPATDLRAHPLWYGWRIDGRLLTSMGHGDPRTASSRPSDKAPTTAIHAK